MNYRFTCPEQKKIRLIIDTDAKNEADDQFAIVHHLLSPKMDIRGLIGAHFENRHDMGKGVSMDMSYKELVHILDLMDMSGKYRVCHGAQYSLPDTKTPMPSEGSQLLVDEAMKKDDRPLFAVFLGTLTDLASAYLQEPRIAEKLNVVWIGGGEWPVGGWEFNLSQDVKAANVVFASNMNLWQVPKDVYKQVKITLAELQLRVRPYGRIGRYLFDQMSQFNDDWADHEGFPHGESWVLGDQPTVSVLIEPHEHAYVWMPAPQVSSEMFYIHEQKNRPIRVYKYVDVRMTMEDFYAKLAVNYPGN
jgi:inosine-uridine nucleoside N-ribohydrolase